MSNEPWRYTVNAPSVREIPDDLLTRFRSEPDIVEELSDRLRLHLGIESGVDFGSFAVKQDVQQHVGVIVTVRYVPKTVPDNDQRLAHDKIAAACTPGAIVVTDAHGCDGSVLGGVGAATLYAGGARVAIVGGIVRDLPEIAAARLAVAGRSSGIRSGRPGIQLAEIGGQITLMQQVVNGGDIGIVNTYGLVAIPAWLDWNEVRRILTG